MKEKKLLPTQRRESGIRIDCTVTPSKKRFHNDPFPQCTEYCSPNFPRLPLRLPPGPVPVPSAGPRPPAENRPAEKAKNTQTGRPTSGAPASAPGSARPPHLGPGAPVPRFCVYTCTVQASRLLLFLVLPADLDPRLHSAGTVLLFPRFSLFFFHFQFFRIFLLS
jgi:hypothetical protein